MIYLAVGLYWLTFAIFLFVPHFLLGGLWRNKAHMGLTLFALSILVTPMTIFVISPNSNMMLALTVAMIAAAYTLGFLFSLQIPPWFSNPILVMCIVFPLIRSPLLLSLSGIAESGIASALNFTVALYAFYCSILSFSYFFRAPFLRKKYHFLIVGVALFCLFSLALVFDLRQFVGVTLLAIAIELAVIAMLTLYFYKIVFSYADIVPIMLGSIIVPLLFWLYVPSLWFVMFLFGMIGYLCQRTEMFKTLRIPPLAAVVVITPVVFALFELADKVYSAQPPFGASITAVIGPVMGLTSIAVGSLLCQALQGLRTPAQILEPPALLYTPYWTPIIIVPLIVLSWLITKQHIFLIFSVLYVCLFSVGKAKRAEAFLYWLTKAGLVILFAFVMMFQHFALIPLVPWFLIDRNVQRGSKLWWRGLKDAWVQTRLDATNSSAQKHEFR
jgi:hypothetical protein